MANGVLLRGAANLRCAFGQGSIAPARLERCVRRSAAEPHSAKPCGQRRGMQAAQATAVVDEVAVQRPGGIPAAPVLLAVLVGELDALLKHAALLHSRRQAQRPRG